MYGMHGRVRVRRWSITAFPMLLLARICKHNAGFRWLRGINGHLLDGWV